MKKRIALGLALLLALPSLAVADTGYRLHTFASNGVYLEYPQFAGEEALNAAIVALWQDLTQFPEYFITLAKQQENTPSYADGTPVVGSKRYRCTVTFVNEDFISFVLTGSTSSPYQMRDSREIHSYTLDRNTLKPIKFTDVFYTDVYKEDLKELFFRAAVPPSQPQILDFWGSESEQKQFFDDMMNYLIELDESPFNVDYENYYYLKPDSIVVGLAVPHVYGDYFEGELPLKMLYDFLNNYVLDRIVAEGQ